MSDADSPETAVYKNPFKSLENAISPTSGSRELDMRYLESVIGDRAPGGQTDDEEMQRMADLLNSLRGAESMRPEKNIIHTPTAQEIEAFHKALETGRYGNFEVLGETSHGGARALRLKHPDNGQEFTLRLGVHEAVDAGLIPDITAGLTPDQFKATIRNSIEFFEANNSVITFELINAWANNIASYDAAGISVKEKNDMQTELEARLYLAAASYRLLLQDYENFANFYTNFDADAFNALRDEVLGPVGMNVIHSMELGTGNYFRLNKPARDATDLGFKYLLARAEAAARVPPVVLPLGYAGIPADIEKKAEAKLNIIKNLFHTTGMSSWYAGPIYPPGHPRAGQLIDADWMDASVQVNLAPPVPGSPLSVAGVPIPPNVDGVTTRRNPPLTPAQLIFTMRENPNMIYARNERYHQQKRVYREANLNTTPPDFYYFPEIDGVTDDPATNMRRLLYFPEELSRLAKLNNTGGRVASLRYAAELYLVTLPQLNGVKTLEDFIGPLGTKEERPSSIVKKGRTFMYASMVKGAGAAAVEMLKLVNEPVKGGENAGADLGKDLANVLGVVEKYSAYLTPIASPNILSLATARILEGTFRWLNGNTADRTEQFPRVPRFGPRLLNAIIKADVFQAFMDITRRNEALAGVNASEARVTGILASQAGIDWSWEVLQVLMKYIAATK